MEKARQRETGRPFETLVIRFLFSLNPMPVSVEGCSGSRFHRFAGYVPAPCHHGLDLHRCKYFDIRTLPHVLRRNDRGCKSMPKRPRLASCVARFATASFVDPFHHPIASHHTKKSSRFWYTFRWKGKKPLSCFQRTRQARFPRFAVKPVSVFRWCDICTICTI